MRGVIKLRRGHSSEWTTDNPVLSSGEPGIELNTGLFKIGDGVKAWNALPYSNNAGGAGNPGPEGPQGPKGDPGDLNKTPVVLADGATISTDASLSTLFRVTLGGNRTLGNPTNPIDGQRIIWELTQDVTGGRTLTLGSAFALGMDFPSVTLSTAAGKRDFLGAIYNSTTLKWYVIAFVKGY